MAVVTKGDVAGHEFHGNQWTGGSEVATIDVYDPQKDQPPKLDGWYKMDSRYFIADLAIAQAQNPPPKTLLYSKDGKKTAAVMLMQDAVDPKGKYDFVLSLATRQNTHGYGMGMVARACAEAVKHGRGIQLRSSDSAIGFYKHIGMHEGNAKVYAFEPEEAKAFVERVMSHMKSWLSDAHDLEPEDSVFTAPATPTVEGLKSNPHHDARGRFASGSSSGAAVAEGKPPKAQSFFSFFSPEDVAMEEENRKVEAGKLLAAEVTDESPDVDVDD